jgi:hypothetical protein
MPNQISNDKIISITQYTLSVQNIRNTLLILSCTPFALRTASIRWGMDSTRCRKRSTGMLAMLTTMLPTVMSSWLDVFWVVDHS